jgi:hypothetical protein
MRTEAGRVADVAHVAEKSSPFRVTQVQLGLDAAVVDIALGQAVADQHDALAFGRRGDRLRARGGGGGGSAFGAWGGVSALGARLWGLQPSASAFGAGAVMVLVAGLLPSA